jgi:SAM-dependent methyltransferase
MKAEFWNEMYKDDSYRYGESPNEFLEEQLAVLKPGKILLPADGEGRNAVFAASEGWQATAVDFSERALQKATELANRKNVEIDTIHGDLTEIQIPEEEYDAIALIYAHFPPSVRAEIHRKLSRALKPGGKLILEAFTPDQLRFTSGGPKDPSMLYTREMLEDDFGELEGVNIYEEATQLNEGPGHSGEARVIRLLGSK